jgi:hypothetical protein
MKATVLSGNQARVGNLSEQESRLQFCKHIFKS